MASDARALAQDGAVAPARRKLLTFDNRYLPPLLITSILVGAHLSFGILEAWYATALAIVTAIGAEMVMGRITYGKWPHPASAYISGISAGILVRSNVLWPYFLTSLISITSKYVLRVKGRHLWNPTNFGVSAAAFLAPATITVLSIQWGNVVAPMAIIWILGSVIVWRVGRAHISATYVASFLLFSLVSSSITGLPWLATVAPITGPMYQLFLFFLVTDPKTTVRSKVGQWSPVQQGGRPIVLPVGGSHIGAGHVKGILHSFDAVEHRHVNAMRRSDFPRTGTSLEQMTQAAQRG